MTDSERLDWIIETEAEVTLDSASLLWGVRWWGLAGFRDEKGYASPRAAIDAAMREEG